MAEFTYTQQGNETFLNIGETRIVIRWNARWVPPMESVTILPSSITLSKSSYTLHIGGSYTLSATVKPDEAEDKDVEWSSSNSEIATVEPSGKVTAVAEGEVVITAKCAADPKIKATCSITVEP